MFLRSAIPQFCPDALRMITLSRVQRYNELGSSNKEKLTYSEYLIECTNMPLLRASNDRSDGKLASSINQLTGSRYEAKCTDSFLKNGLEELFYGVRHIDQCLLNNRSQVWYSHDAM